MMFSQEAYMLAKEIVFAVEGEGGSYQFKREKKRQRAVTGEPKLTKDERVMLLRLAHRLIGHNEKDKRQIQAEVDLSGFALRYVGKRRF